MIGVDNEEGLSKIDCEIGKDGEVGRDGEVGNDFGAQTRDEIRNDDFVIKNDRPQEQCCSLDKDRAENGKEVFGEKNVAVMSSYS